MKEAPLEIKSQLPWLSIRSERGVEGKRHRAKAHKARKLALRQARLNQCGETHLSTDDHLTAAQVHATDEAPTIEKRPKTLTATQSQPMAPTTALAVKQTRKKIVIKIKMDRYVKVEGDNILNLS